MSFAKKIRASPLVRKALLFYRAAAVPAEDLHQTWRSTRGFPNHQLSGDFDFTAGAALSGIGMQYRLNGSCSDLGARDHNRRQLRIGQFCQPDVVTSDHGNISWYVQSRASQFAQSSHGHQIIRGDDRRRPVLQCQEFSDGLRSALQLEVAFVDYWLCMQRRSMLLHRFEKRLTPELRGLEMLRSADESNLPVVQLKQMFNRLMNALFIVHTNVACMWSNLSDVQKHYGDSAGRQALDHR